MFKSKQQIDIKKTLSKFLDLKRDCFSRLRYLRVLIDFKDDHEVKEFLYNNHSVVYSAFFEMFIQLDAARFRGKTSGKDDVELLLFIFEKILTMLPELIEKRWQINSILFIFKKFLHHNNIMAIRQEGVRLFLIFYQILGEANVKANPHIEILYASLIPGVVNDNRIISTFDFKTPDPHSPVQPFYNEPFIPDYSYSAYGSSSVLGSSNLEPKKENHSLNFTNFLLDYSISQCNKILWKEYRDRKQLRGFEFLFASFARIYLPYIFPKMASINSENEWPVYTVRNLISIYHLPEELPSIRKYFDCKHYSKINGQNVYPVYVEVQLVIINWFTRHLLGPNKMLDHINGSSTLTPQNSGNVESNLSKFSSHSISSQSLHTGSNIASNILAASTAILHPPFPLSIEPQTVPHSSANETELVCSLLNSRRIYVDLVLSFFHEAFHMPFHDQLVTLMRNVLKVYKQWIYKEIDSPLPLFLAEPQSYSNSNSSISTTSTSSFKSRFNDDNVCAGFNNLLCIFIMSSANVFLLEVPSQERQDLDSQVDVCKRVLNIYRYMVMKVEMDKSVWETLVQVLIQITHCIISKDVPKKRDDTVGGRLAPALFQTLIVTWIKANLNVQLSLGLWGKFHDLVSSLTRWEELILEWSNTMNILNRIMSRYVFQINLNELPLEKMLSDRKRKIRDASKNLNNNHLLKSNNDPAGVAQNQTARDLPGNTEQTVGRTNSDTHRMSNSSRVSVNRFVSNESNCSENSFTQRSGHRGSVIGSKLFRFNSILRHREYHGNSNANKHLCRTLSDSCLVLSVRHSVCGMRYAYRKRFKGRRQSKMLPPKRLKNMPMIDDEVDEEENCTLVDVDGHYADLDGELSDNDSSLEIDDYFNENLFAIYQQQRNLYRFHSMEDLFLASNQHSFEPECSSLKDTPMAFDSTSAASTCSSSVTEQMCIGGMGNNLMGKQITTDSLPSRPVLMGGNNRGWNADISVMLWRRMLGILGDINDFEDPAIHKLAFKCLANLTDDLIKIKDNISYLNGASQEVDNAGGHLLQPSLHYFSAWLFRATQLPNEYKEGKLVAYKLLCIIALHRGERELNRDFLILFYLAIKRALSTYDMELTCTIIRYCALKFFSSALPGSSCLLFDFISSANLIVSSLDVSQQHARVEAINLLGSLIGFFDVYSNVQILRYSSSLPSLDSYKDLKEHVLEILIIASKREQTGLGRAISFCSLGICLYKEFLRGTDYHRLKEIITILLAGTRLSIKRPKSAASPSPSVTTANVDNNSKFNNRILCRVACDMLKLQADHATYLVDKHPDIVRRILEGLCHTLSLHIEVLQQTNTFRDFKNLLLNIMFCIAHWCMSVNKEYLTNTMVSRDYPTFVEESLNKYSDSRDPNSGFTAPRITLLDLVIFLFTNITNLNSDRPGRSNEPVSLNEMDTIDYTITNTASLYAKGDEPSSGTSANDIETLKKAAHLILMHFLNFMGHFPLPKLRTVSLCSLINENDDNTSTPQSDKVDYEALNSPNVLVFIVNNTCLMSFVELPPEAVDSTVLSKISHSNEMMSLHKAKPIRVIIRNLLGKFCWDCVMLTSPVLADRRFYSRQASITRELSTLNANSINGDGTEDEDSSFTQPKDSLALLVNGIHNTSPECRSQDKNDFLQHLNQLPEAVDTVALLTNQHYQESRFVEEKRVEQSHQRKPTATVNGDVDHINDSNQDSCCSSLSSSVSTTSIDPAIAFQYCRQMIEQFGFLSWDKRANIDMISKNQSTIRELRHLDSQRCRDKHKIAVIYVGYGQETREAILGNKSGSRAYEEFVGRLGWEVNLANHVGFMGGLESNLSTGRTAPYFADSFNEVIFHVSTRLEPASGDHQADKQQLMNKKMRHLGNDEIHIVWSEHYKDYRRSILATEFCDALIVIHPLPVQTYPNLFRIQISRKPEVPFFGPLFNGAVVHRDELANLVRITAINASRAKRLHLAAYKPFFEERYDSINKFATVYKERSTFEEYATKIYAPRYDLLHRLDCGEDLSQPTFNSSGFVSIESFIQATSGMASSPSNADSVSIASTGASSYTISEALPMIGQGLPGPQPVAQMAPSNSSTSIRGSRPTSRSSFTQR